MDGNPGAAPGSVRSLNRGHQMSYQMFRGGTPCPDEDQGCGWFGQVCGIRRLSLKCSELVGDLLDACCRCLRELVEGIAGLLAAVGAVLFVRGVVDLLRES